MNKYGVKWKLVKKGEGWIIDEVAKQFSLYSGPLKTVVEIGAHNGELSCLATTRGAGRVLAIEPSTENFRVLVENINQNKMWDTITPLNLAVASREGMISLRTKEGLNSGQKSLCYRAAFERVELVPAVSLKTIINIVGHVDYLLVDVEGGEFDIFWDLLAKKDPILQKIGYLDLEIHDPKNTDYFASNQIYGVTRLFQLLMDNGFVPGLNMREAVAR